MESRKNYELIADIIFANERRNSEWLIEEIYREYLAILLEALNEVNKNITYLDELEASQIKIITALRMLDESYVKSCLQAQNDKIKTILFTRHGSSSNSKKKLGLNPNATICVKAKLAMKITEPLTASMLGNEVNTKIYISPMVRALQTASLIIPRNFPGKIEISSNITEKSHVPSGKDIRTRSALNKVGVSGKISDFLFGYRIETIVKPERIKALQILQEKIAKDKNEKIEDKECEIIEDDKKIINIQQAIDDLPQGYTMWNICHGKISKKFFREKLNYETDFIYGETKKILYYQDNEGNNKVFIPSYSLVINQESGFFEVGHATMKIGKLKIPDQQKSVEILLEKNKSLLIDHSLFYKQQQPNALLSEMQDKANLLMVPIQEENVSKNKLK